MILTGLDWGRQYRITACCSEKLSNREVRISIDVRQIVVMEKHDIVF